jgi:hypothetical protein
MSAQGWVDCIATQGPGTALTAAAEARLIGDVTFPAGYFNAGRAVRVVIWGKASNAVTTPGTITFRVRWGGLAGTLLVASAALAQNVAAQTDKTFRLEFLIRCVTDGASGSVIVFGEAQRGNCAVGATSDITPDVIPASGPAAVTVDTTAAAAIAVTAQPSLGTASIQALFAQFESLN